MGKSWKEIQKSWRQKAAEREARRSTKKSVTEIGLTGEDIAKLTDGGKRSISDKDIERTAESKRKTRSRKASGRRTAGEVGLTGEDIAELTDDGKKQISSKDIKRRAIQKAVDSGQRVAHRKDDTETAQMVQEAHARRIKRDSASMKVRYEAKKRNAEVMQDTHDRFMDITQEAHARQQKRDSKQALMSGNYNRDAIAAQASQLERSPVQESVNLSHTKDNIEAMQKASSMADFQNKYGSDRIPTTQEMEQFYMQQDNIQKKQSEQEYNQLRAEGLDFDIRHPIQSARRFSKGWGAHLNQKVQAYHDDLPAVKWDSAVNRRRSQAYSQMIELSSSQESVNPMQMRSDMSNFQSEIEKNTVSIKDQGSAAAGLVMVGAVKIGKNVVDMALNPVDTAKGFAYSVSHPVETVKSLVENIVENPISGTVETVGTVWLTGKATKWASRKINPYVKDTPVKARSIRRVSTKRKLPDGSVVPDEQIAIETYLGKARTRHYKDAPMKARKQINIEADYVRSGSFTPLKYGRMSGRHSAVLHLKNQGKSVKYDVKNYMGDQKLDIKMDPALGYSGKTSIGNPLSGTTPGIRPGYRFVKSSWRRRAYEYTQKPKVEGVYKDGEYISVKKPGKNVQVPESSGTRMRLLSDRIYSKKSGKSGTLVSQEVSVGKFVKRQYNRKPQSAQKGSGPQDPASILFEIDKKGNVKAYNYLESGKKVSYLGEKPLSPSMQKLSDSIRGWGKPVKSASKSGSSAKAMSVSEPVKSAKASQVDPVIDVITKEPMRPTVPYMDTTSQKSTESIKPQKEYMPPYEKLLPQRSYNKASSVSLMSETELTEEDKQQSVMIESDLAIQSDETTKEKSMTTTTTTTEQSPSTTIEPSIDTVQKQSPSEMPILKPAQGMDLGKINIKWGDVPGFEDALLPPQDKKKKKSKKDDDFWKGFDVFVKKKGEMVKINTKGSLPKDEAFMLGAFDVDNTASASFKLMRSSDPLAAKAMRKGMKSDSLRKQFYEKNDMFIEKSQYRIDTRGEVQGISYLGQAAKKTRDFANAANRILPKVMDQFAVPSIANEGKRKGKRKSRSKDNLFGGGSLW